MPGAALQLASTGVQDAHLTRDPEIDVFKYRYFRYVNFASEFARVELNEAADFGRRVSAVIPHRGHLLTKLFLRLKLPPLTPRGGTYASWTDALGHALVEHAELEVNGVVVDRQYGYFMEMANELAPAGATGTGTDVMVLRSDSYRAARHNAARPVELLVPLEFWFSRQPNLALPLLCMSASQVRVTVALRAFSSVVHYDGDEPPPVRIAESELLAEYVYLDDAVTASWRAQPHTYIIRQVQFNGPDAVFAGATSFAAELKFNHAVSELVFAFVDVDSIESNDLFHFSRRADGAPLLSSASLVLDGQSRTDSLPESFYRLVTARAAHSAVPTKHVYCIPFAARPEHAQPTGSLNFSRFDSAVLQCTMSPGNGECVLYVFATNYNVLVVENGVARLEYAV